MPTDRNDPDANVPAPIGHATAVHAPPSDAPEWALHAYAELKRGVAEIPGKAANDRILQYFKATNLGMNPMAYSDETPWCSAFVCWCIEQAGLKSTKSAGARSWMSWGQRAVTPTYGAITVFWRTAPNSISGHVGFYAGETASSIWVLGGNQNNSVSIAKYPRSRLLGYRMPK